MNGSMGKGKALAALTAAIAWAGILLQLYLSLRLTDSMGMSTVQGLGIYFGYFTILTNLLVCVALTLPLAAPASAWGRHFARPFAVGGVAAGIAFVGVAYYVLLRHVWAPQGLQLLADVLLHYAVPILFVLYSLVVLRGALLRWTAPLWWSLYPVAYFVYALLRGELMGRYPYRFIDVSSLGYAQALRNAGLLWVAFVLLAYLLMLVWWIAAARVSPPGRTPP